MTLTSEPIVLKMSCYVHRGSTARK